MDTSILEQEFPPEQIKQRKGPRGIILDYVESASVIRRLNQAFDYNWSWEIDNFEIRNNEVVVLGKLTAEGISKMQFGSKKLLNGKKSTDEEIGDACKAAGSDCLKKCSTLFGIGLHLYKDDNNHKQNGSGMAKRTPNKGNNKVTKAQLAKIKQLRLKLGWEPQKAMDLVKELHNVNDPLEMNTVMASNVIAVGNVSDLLILL